MEMEVMDDTPKVVTSIILLSHSDTDKVGMLYRDIHRLVRALAPPDPDRHRPLQLLET